MMRHQRAADIAALDIRELEIPVWSVHCLLRARIKTVGDISGYTRSELARLQLSTHALDMLSMQMDRFGLPLTLGEVIENGVEAVVTLREATNGTTIK